MIELVDKKLKVDGIEWELPYRVQDAFESGSNIIVLFDSDEGLSLPQFNNLVCFDRNAQQVWIAELPIDTPRDKYFRHAKSDVYYSITSRKPLVAYSFTSYEAEIDLDTGKIIKKTFTK